MRILVVTEQWVSRVREPELLARFPERTALTERWALTVAMKRAYALMLDGRWTHFLMLGRRAASAFGLREDAEMLRWYDVLGVHLAVLPLSAPGASGREVRAFLRRTLEESRQDEAVPA